MTKSHREQGLDYWEAEELSWCPSWSNSLWHGWSCGLVYSSGGNATDPIWIVLASSYGISSWTPLKPQIVFLVDCLSNGNPVHVDHGRTVKKMDHQKFVGGFALSGLLGSGRTSMLSLGTLSLCPKAVWSIPYVSVAAFFPSLKQNFIAYRSSNVSSHPDCIFEIRQLWQSGFRRVYSNCCCSCSFEAEIIKIGQSSHKMYSNNIVNFQESTTILNACTKKSGDLLKAPRT